MYQDIYNYICQIKVIEVDLEYGYVIDGDYLIADIHFIILCDWVSWNFAISHIVEYCVAMPSNTQICTRSWGPSQ